MYQSRKKLQIRQKRVVHDDPYMDGINLSTDSYFPPEVEVRLVRLVTNRDYVRLRESLLRIPSGE